MMIGPAPMTRIEEMSVRLGIKSFPKDQVVWSGGHGRELVLPIAFTTRSGSPHQRIVRLQVLQFLTEGVHLPLVHRSAEVVLLGRPPAVRDHVLDEVRRGR